MEMLERCPGCSVAREAEPKKAESASHQARPCSHCGYDGPFPPPEPEVAAPRDSLPSFAGARAKLATATQDLFRLSGSHSIPVDTALSDPPAAPSVPEPSSQARKPEASMMFSLEALMRANQPAPKREDTSDQASSQLWDMQASTPLFGTAYDEALLTTPLKMEPAQSMDSMTLPSQTPNGRRWWPFLLAATAGLALAGAGIWVFGASNGSALRGVTPSSEQAALSAEVKAPQELAQPLPEPPGAAELAAGDHPGANPGGTAGGEPVAAAAATEPPAGQAPPSEAEATAAKVNAGAGAGEGTEPRDNAPSSTKPEGEKAGKDRTIKKPTARVEKPTAPPKLGAAVFAFDKAAAKGALNAAAEAAASCGAGGEPGKGKIQVTFAPTGKVSEADLVEGPFAGTTAGKCALRHFKAAKVPAFSGAPVTVAKSFRVD